MLLADLVAVCSDTAAAVGGCFGDGAGKSVWPASVRAPHGSRRRRLRRVGLRHRRWCGRHQLAGDAAGHVCRLGVLHRLSPRVDVLAGRHACAGDCAGVVARAADPRPRAGLWCRPGVAVSSRGAGPVRERELLVVEAGRLDAVLATWLRTDSTMAAARRGRSRRRRRRGASGRIRLITQPLFCGRGGGIGNAVLPTESGQRPAISDS